MSTLLSFARHNPFAFVFLSICAAFFVMALRTDLMTKETRR